MRFETSPVQKILNPPYIWMRLIDELMTFLAFGNMFSTCRSTAKKWWAVRWRGVDRRAIKLSGQSPSFTVAVVGSWSLQQLPFNALSLPSKLKVAFSNAVLSAFHILEDFFFDIWTPRYTRIFLFVRTRKRCFDNPSRVKGTSIKAVPQVFVRNRLFLGSNEKET